MRGRSLAAPTRGVKLRLSRIARCYAAAVRKLCVLWALALAGCSTVVPHQTATTLPAGAYRLGAQLSATPWCGFAVPPSQASCASWPRGPPTPELRLNARYGVTDGFDLGASFHGAAVLGRSYRLGLYVDGKAELWSRELGEGRRQVLSIAPGLGYHSEEVPTSITGLAELNVALPLLFGHRGELLEWVFGAGAIERLQFADSQAGDGTRSLYPDTQFLLLTGVTLNRRWRPGVQLTFQAPVTLPGYGLFTLSFALSYDLLPTPQ